MSSFRSKSARKKLLKSIKINKICDVMCWTSNPVFWKGGTDHFERLGGTY